MSKDVSEIRRMLQVYDASASAPSSRQAVGMLEGITKLVATNPDAYDLLEDPSDAEAWTSAGGESFCENQEFTGILAARWLEVLSKPGFENAGFDKEELEGLKDRLKGWAAAIVDTGLEFGDVEELMTTLDELITDAPDADDDDDDDDEDEDDSDD